MSQKSDLEKYVEYGVSGTPQIKGDEKRKWLGEFRERVIFAVGFEQIYKKEALEMIEEKCKNERVNKIIVESTVKDGVVDKVMDFARKYKKDYKTVDSKSSKKEIALVLASKDAVHEGKVMVDF